MKEIKSHPYITKRTIKAWETNDKKFLQVIDVRDIYHWNYSVEYELVPGALDSIYSDPNLDRCFEFIKKFMERNPNL